MSEVWLTNPNLTPAHDMKVLRAAVGTWAGSGWQVREDQSDPEVELAEDPAVGPDQLAAPDRFAEPEPDVVPAPEPDVVDSPATKPVPKIDPVTTKKGD